MYLENVLSGYAQAAFLRQFWRLGSPGQGRQDTFLESSQVCYSDLKERWMLMNAVFKKYGTTCLPSVYFWTSTPVYFVSDADAFRVINNERRIFDKDSFDLVSSVKIFSRGGDVIGWKDRCLWKEYRLD